MAARRVNDDLLASQLAYYEARAPEYDDWFFRRGRYDRGPRASAQWFDEVAQVRERLAGEPWRGRDVLELAPGTGLWSEWLLAQGARLSVVEGSPAMVAQLAERLGPDADAVEVTVADLFTWTPTRRYEAVFFGFFLSHVPLERLDDFFSHVANTLVPGGVVAFVDSRRETTSTAHDHTLPETGDEVMTRRLDDGREFEIVKNFFEPAVITSAAARAGIALDVRVTPMYFVHGLGTAS